MSRRLTWVGVLLLLLTGAGSLDVAAQTAVPDPGITGDVAIADAAGSGLVRRQFDLTRRMSATPADPAGYLLRAGDLINVLVLTGEDNNISLEVQLAQDGSIALPWVDPIMADGLTIAQTSTLVQNAYGNIYRRAFAQVTLQRLGSFLVQLRGYHPFPGLYRVYNGTSLYGFLLALDVEMDGERRFVTLRRTAEVQHGDLLALAPEMSTVGSFDALDFSVRGKIELDRFLQAFDSITIEEPEVVVQLESGVARPGKYAVNAGEGLQEILELAGEVDRASDLQNTVLTRYEADGSPTLVYLDLQSILASLESFPLQNRDRIQIVPYRQVVYVMGNVTSPGAYPIQPGEGIMELLTKAGGLNERAHARSISLLHPPRLFSDLAEPYEVAILDIRTFIKPGEQRTQPALVQPGDIVYVPAKGDRISGASILGAVSAAFARIQFN